jgi:D-inositol-3-phosphate glycosyltransferase
VDAFAEGVGKHLADLGDVDALHANYWLSGVAGHQLKHALDLPLVSTFHTLARVKAETGDPEPARRVRAEADVIGCSDAILASCRAEAEQLVRLYGADPTRVELVPPGVDHAFFSPGDRAGARAALAHLHLGEGPVLLFVGRIQPLKGLDVAVRALAALGRPDATLVAVGGASGPEGAHEVARIRALVDELGVAEQVRFVEPQPHHLLSTYYRAADVCVVPSRSESFGLVALEAGACGTPVVAAAVGGLRTLVDDGHTGFLVEDRDPDRFAERIGALLADEALAVRLGAQAAQRARGYTWSTAAGRLRRIYGDLTARTLVDCR